MNVTLNVQPRADAEPTLMRDGLAIDAIGEGEPLLLMPYPHGFGGVPIAHGPLAAISRELNRRVIAFDPPRAFRSTRQALVTMPEMLGCADETLHTLSMHRPIVLVGHSMGGLCAIAFALAYPQRVKKLILIGTLFGGSAIQRGRGMPWGTWLTGLDRWRFTFWGFRLGWGIGSNLALHKRMVQLLARASYVDRSFIPAIDIEAGDNRRPAPVRDVWPRTVFMSHLDYRARLNEIRVPTQICVGRFDPQAPVACSEELAAGIPGARLAIFEHSGHHPFVEERDLFKHVIEEFLASA